VPRHCWSSQSAPSGLANACHILILALIVGIAFLIFLRCSTERGTVMKKFVTLSVSGMTCEGCVSHVEKALQKVDGVQRTEVNYEKKEAMVAYDDAMTGIEALTKATERAGYPSEAKK
jgi:mercuric ion binding protein